MGYEVTINDPVYPKGTEFAVGDYFLAINGETVEVDDLTAERFRVEMQQTLKQGLGKPFEVKATKSEKFVPEPGSTDSRPEIHVDTEPETLVSPLELKSEGGEN